MSDTLFTSESVSEGHPDKVADQISDAVLDAILAQDKHARVACETLVKTGVAIVAGEVTTSAWVDLEELVREVITDIGYTSSQVGFDGATCGVMNLIGKQSVDIAAGVVGCARTPRARCRFATVTACRSASTPWCCRPSTTRASRSRTCAKR